VYSDSNRNGGAAVLTEPLSITRRAAPRTGTRIAAVAVSDTADALTQAQVLERLGLSGDEFAERIFARSGVKQRHLNLSDDFLGRTLQGRTELIEQELLAHSIEAVERLQIDPQRIGTVISASLYSLGCPTIAHRLVEHFQMDPTTDKYHITGVGCASGVPLMRLAAQTMHEHPEKHALIVAADSMSGTLMSATEDDPKAKTVGSAIFGDGCAAALLSNDPRAGGPLIVASQVHQIADTLGAVRLDVQGEGAYLHLARELPDLAAAGLPAVVAGFLRRNQLEHADIDHWVVHPGGRRIVENVQSALELSAEDVATSWDALADHGNIGTPSILYVLKDTIERYKPTPGERGLLVTIGPGVTVGLMLVSW
jgi:predicted naringenin-chalcone synthase